MTPSEVLNRRSFLRTSAALGVAGGLGRFGAPAYAQSDLPDPQSVLDEISVKKYVKEDYQKLFNMSGEPLWDPELDWIRTVDWEAVRATQAGTTVNFAIGAADAESATAALKPFQELSGIKVELVPIPDDASTTRWSPSSSPATRAFDALQFFSPWLGDFAAPGFLAKLDEYAAKWELPLDDFYDTYKLNYGYWGGTPASTASRSTATSRWYTFASRWSRRSTGGDPSTCRRQCRAYDESRPAHGRAEQGQPGRGRRGPDGRPRLLVDLHLGAHRRAVRHGSL